MDERRTGSGPITVKDGQLVVPSWRARAERAEAQLAEARALLTSLRWAMDGAHCYNAEFRARYERCLEGR